MKKLWPITLTTLLLLSLYTTQIFAAGSMTLPFGDNFKTYGGEASTGYGQVWGGVYAPKWIISSDGTELVAKSLDNTTLDQTGLTDQISIFEVNADRTLSNCKIQAQIMVTEWKNTTDDESNSYKGSRIGLVLYRSGEGNYYRAYYNCVSGRIELNRVDPANRTLRVYSVYDANSNEFQNSGGAIVPLANRPEEGQYSSFAFEAKNDDVWGVIFTITINGYTIYGYDSYAYDNIDKNPFVSGAFGLISANQQAYFKNVIVTDKNAGAQQLKVGVMDFGNVHNDKPVGTKIENASELEGGKKLTSKTAVESTSPTLILVIALYRDGVIENISYNSVVTAAVGNSKYIKSILTLPQDVTGCTVKSFIWDGFENIKPIAVSYEID